MPQKRPPPPPAESNVDKPVDDLSAFSSSPSIETLPTLPPPTAGAKKASSGELPAAQKPPPLPKDVASGKALSAWPASLPTHLKPDLASGRLLDDVDLPQIEVIPQPDLSGLSPEDLAGPRPIFVSRNLPLGEMLMEAGVIKSEQLEMALAEQRRTKQLLGEVLTTLGFTTETVIAETVAKQTGIPFTRVKRDPMNGQLIKLVPEDMCRKHRLVPLGLENGMLHLAMANPFDVVAIDALRDATGLIPVPFIAPWSEILGSIERSFSARESFDDSFERLIAAAEARLGADEQEVVSRGPLVELVDQLIIHAVEERATDIHIEPEEMVVRVRYRVDSVLQPGPMIPKKLQSAIIARIKVMAELNISESRLPQDGRIRFENKGRQVDLRVSTFLCNFGENVVLRVLDKSSVVLSLEKLGWLQDDREKFDRIISKPHGIVLVTGPTGSGKTTTLYAALSMLNTVDVNIMTIEDPIEYELTLIRQSQVNTKAGITFATGLRALLRQDPDIILIGEMRDQETAQMAVRAAMTGHLVFSTLHTNTAVGAVPRLVDMGVEPMLISDTVLAIIAQRLGRSVCPHCNERVECPPARRAELEAAAAFEKLNWDGKVAEARGCPQCRMRGYHGRMGLFEIFEMNAEAQDLIMKRRYGSELHHAVLNTGMRTMYGDGLRRVLLGQMTLDELDRVIDRELREAMN